jgi:hypothetical protein
MSTHSSNKEEPLGEVGTFVVRVFDLEETDMQTVVAAVAGYKYEVLEVKDPPKP